MCHIPWEAGTAHGTGVLAVATIGLIVVAWRGPTGWRETLRNDRIDSTVSAGRDLEGELGRVINAKANGWDFSMTNLWDAWRRFDCTFYVLRRYHDELSSNLSDDVAEQIRQLGEQFREGGNWWERASQTKVENLLKPIYEIPIKR
jgi:hypothetical protein